MAVWLPPWARGPEALGSLGRPPTPWVAASRARKPGPQRDADALLVERVRGATEERRRRAVLSDDPSLFDDLAPWEIDLGRRFAAQRTNLFKSAWVVLRSAERHGLGRSEIGDAVDRALNKAWFNVRRSVGSYRNEAAFASWLRSVVRNAAYDELRTLRSKFDDSIAVEADDSNLTPRTDGRPVPEGYGPVNR